MAVDAALVAIWAQGWAKSRLTAPPVMDRGARRIEVGLPDQIRRFVFPEPPLGVAAIAASIAEPHVLMKIPCEETTVRAALPARFLVQRTGVFMALDSLPSLALPPPPEYRVTTMSDGDVLLAEVHAPDGSVAARGYAALVADWAIHDRIATEEPHRRRGLAGVVMATLGALAAGRGVRRGVLVATDMGAALYATLGWRALSPYVTAQLAP